MIARVLHLSKGFVAVVSDGDWHRVCKYRWHVHVSGGRGRKPGQPYARANINGVKVYLHRFVMDAPEYMQVDHRNHQTLDCRRENLRICDHLTNQKNKRNCKAKSVRKIENNLQATLDV